MVGIDLTITRVVTQTPWMWRPNMQTLVTHHNGVMVQANNTKMLVSYVWSKKNGLVHLKRIFASQNVENIFVLKWMWFWLTCERKACYKCLDCNSGKPKIKLCMGVKGPDNDMAVVARRLQGPYVVYAIPRTILMSMVRAKPFMRKTTTYPITFCILWWKCIVDKGSCLGSHVGLHYYQVGLAEHNLIGWHSQRARFSSIALWDGDPKYVLGVVLPNSSPPLALWPSCNFAHRLGI